MPVGIGDFCIQDTCISKLTTNSRNGIAFYYDHISVWLIQREYKTPLTIEEFLKALDNTYCWEKSKEEIKLFLREAFIYAIKTSYGIDLNK